MITITGNITNANEQQAYINFLQEKYDRKLESIDMEADGDFVNLNYQFEHIPFERIRRITGYLVGTMDHWNDAKTSEEKDRVKHSLSDGTIEQI